jgi:hypothetical protein
MTRAEIAERVLRALLLHGNIELSYDFVASELREVQDCCPQIHALDGAINVLEQAAKEEAANEE